MTDLGAYASEVWNAAQRDGLHAELLTAESVPLTTWVKFDESQKPAAQEIFLGSLSGFLG